jgi:hypothetical protein
MNLQPLPVRGERPRGMALDLMHAHFKRSNGVKLTGSPRECKNPRNPRALYLGSVHDAWCRWLVATGGGGGGGMAARERSAPYRGSVHGADGHPKMDVQWWWDIWGIIFLWRDRRREPSPQRHLQRDFQRTATVNITLSTFVTGAPPCRPPAFP